MTLTLGLNDVTLTTAAQTIITTGPADSFLATKVLACNTDTVARTVTAYRVPPAGTAGAGNAIVDGSGATAFTLGAGETIPLPLSGVAFAAGYTLQALADASGVVNISASWTY